MAVHGMSRKILSTAPFGEAGASAPTVWLGRAAVRFNHWLAWRADYRASIKELRSLSDRDLDDIGIIRCDIPAIARQSADQAAASRR